MANWSAGLKTLGEGLGRMGVVKKQEEENHLEALRREAIEELRREHDTTMLDKRMTHDKGLFDARETAEAERQRTSEAGADRRSNAQIAAQDRRSVDSAIANVNANSSRQLIAIANARQKIQLARAEAGDMADPGSIAQWDAAMADLEDQALMVNESRVLEIRRIREGNYGKPLSEQEANDLAIGAKRENSEDVVAAAAAGAPAAPNDPAAAAAPAAAGAPAFDPLGPDFDYARAHQTGMKPAGPEAGENEGHYGTVSELTPEESQHYGVPPGSFLVLKGRKHKSWAEGVAGEEARGYEIVQRGDRFFSVPSGAAETVTGAQTENGLFQTGIRLGPLSPDEFRHPPGIEKAKDWLQTQRSGHSPNDRRRGGSR